jgi:signal transduction histidine kinase/ActR/RegA family two-component response regulator
MKVGVGYSDHPETTVAGVKAIESAIKQAGRSDPCDLVLLFSTAIHDPSVLREAVVSVVGASVPIYGGGTAGVITNDYFGYAGDQVGAACLWLDGVRCDVLTEDKLDKSEEETGIRLGKRLAERGTTPESPVLLFYDAVDTTNGLRLMMATPLLAGLEKGLGFPPDLSGVGMIGDLACSAMKQWIGDKVGKANAIALVFSGDIRMDSVIMHGCRPATPYYTVTKSMGPVILEINGEPAIPFIDKLLGGAITPEQYPFFLIFGVNHGERWGEFDEDAYASRLCLAIDKASGGIVMFEPDMVAGTEFQLMFRSLEIDYIKPTIDKAFDDLGDRTPVFGVFIDCAGRCGGYAGADREDAVIVQQTVAGRVPVLGLYNGVEVAPIGGRPRGLDWSGVFCLFSQSSDGSKISPPKTMSAAWEESGTLLPSEKLPLDALTRLCEKNVAKVLALDTTATAVRIELEQKRRGFALLAELTTSLQQNTDHVSTFFSVARRINAALNMQRTVVLQKGDDNRFSPVVLQGYSANEKAAFAGRPINVPAELLNPTHPVIVTRADSADQFQDIRERLGLPYFVSFPVLLQGNIFAILITGRLVEAPPYLIRLSRSDADNIQAIGVLLASVLMGQRLLAAEERNRIMADAMPTCCLFWDENGVLTDCNHAALSLFELPNKEEFLQWFLSHVPELQSGGNSSTEVSDPRIREAFVTGYVRFNWTHMTATGEPLPTEVTLIRVPKGEGYTLVGYIRDLRDQNAAARYTKAKNEFLASISHEIRTPLNAVQSLAHILSETKGLSESQQSLMEQGMRSVKLLTTAIDTLLDFSKLDTGQLTLEAAEFSVKELVESTAGLVRKEAEEKSLSLHTTVDPDVPQWVQGDFVRLQQILFNIAINAVKFTETGGVDIHVYRADNAPVHHRSDKVPLVIEVRDTGIGIAEEYMDDLFKPLFVSERAYSRKHSGMGMGLAIGEGLAKLMGGHITCESQVGKGSIFRISINLSVPKQETETKKTDDREVLRGMRVLVAEDNKINQMVIRELLASVGIVVTLSDNGLKALEKLREETFDLVLMDIQMPEMDGLTATAQIRADRRFDSLPVLAMTAHAGPEHLAESLSAGMNDHLTKPVDVERLYGALTKWGRRK